MPTGSGGGASRGSVFRPATDESQAAVPEPTAHFSDPEEQSMNHGAGRSHNPTDVETEVWGVEPEHGL